MSDLELFHNFCTSTYTTFSDDAMIQIIWQHAIPKLAYSSVYVMHGIMAVSALQLAKARLEMKEAFVSHARAHYASALSMARPAVANISAQNAAEVYAFSMITVVFALGSPRTAEDILFVENEGIADWLYLLRGILVIIVDFYETLHQGILGPMFLKGADRARDRDSLTTMNVHLQAYENHLRKTVNDPAMLEILLRSTAELHKTLAGRFEVQLGASEATDILHWPIRVPHDYLTYLSQHRSEALIVLAFFCVALHSTRNIWWLEGCSFHLMGRIYSLLQDQDRIFIQWPMMETGWMPT